MVDRVTTAAHIKHGAYSVGNNKDALYYPECWHLQVNAVQFWILLWKSQALHGRRIGHLNNNYLVFSHRALLVWSIIFCLWKVFNDLEIPRDRDWSGEKLERDGQNDVWDGKAMTIFTERTLMIRQTRMNQHPKPRHQEWLTEIRIFKRRMKDAKTCGRSCWW